MANPKKVELDIFDRVNNIKFSDTVRNQSEYTIETYFEYLENLKQMSNSGNNSKKFQEAFLLNMKQNDIKVNHLLEHEDSLLISIYNYIMKTNAIDELIKRNGESLSVDDFKEYHRILLQGTFSDKGLNNYLRINNEAFVGTYNLDGSKDIHYLPLDYNNIPEALKLLVDYYNNNELASVNDIIIKPFLFHALVACLQLFKDGNTRFARVLQHAKIWNFTNQYNLQTNNSDFQLKMPAIYLTDPYKLYRDQYRKIIQTLVTENKDENWNNWLLFNIYRMQEALYKANDDLEKVKTRIKSP